MHNRFLLLVALVVLCSIANSQVPSRVSYQGLLTDPAGQPVADGNYDLKFDLYNALAAGTLRHTETQMSVEVLRGTFNVILGAAAPLPAIFSEQLFIEITVISGPGIGSPITFSPRTELTSAPYALAPWVPSGTNVSFSAGNVGIGTASAEQSLSLQGMMGFYPTIWTLPSKRGMYMYHAGTSGNIYAFNYPANEGDPLNLAAKDFFIHTYDGPHTVTRMFLANNGNLGVGTMSPVEKLDVAGTIQTTGFRMPTAAVSGYVLTSDASGLASWQPAPTGGGSQWTTSGSNIFYNAGNVGIGTANPTFKVDVLTDIDGQGFHARTNSAIGVGYNLTNLTTSGQVGLAGNVGNWLATATAGDLVINNDYAFNLLLGTNNTERMRITGAGNVGIGTTTPNQKLGINGMVGIYPTPWVAPTTRGLFMFHGGSAATIYAYNYPGNDGDLLGLNGKSIEFATYVSGSAPTRMTITNSGNVGIGTTTPSSTLDVRGSITSSSTTAPSMRLFYDSPSPRDMVMYWDAANDRANIYSSIPGVGYRPLSFTASAYSFENGNVGIGTTTPSEKLEVAGNVKIGSATIRSGTGSPEGAVAGNIGDLYLRTDGGPGTTMYVKESNNGGNTGWAAK